MEVEHEKTFSEMRANLSASEKESTVFDPEGGVRALFAGAGRYAGLF